MKIVISERKLYNTIRKAINEAMSNNFSVSQLKQYMDADMVDVRNQSNYQYKIEHILKRGVDYCNKMFGQPIGGGSSRYVYQLDDTRVVKLAINYKGIQQNKEEYSAYYKAQDKMFMPIVYNDSDANDFYYLISEHVLPATNEDFEEIFGTSFGVICSVIYDHDQLTNETGLTKRFIDYLDFMENNGININDWAQINNWGLTKRNGKPFLVTLDNGFSNEVAKNLYNGGQGSFRGSDESAKKLGYGSNYNVKMVNQKKFFNGLDGDIGQRVVAWAASHPNDYYRELMYDIDAKYCDKDLLYDLLGEYIEYNVDGVDPWEEDFDLPEDVYSDVALWVMRWVAHNKKQ